MESRPDVIVITAKHEEDLAADRADVLVTIKGSSLVTGRAALKQAKEVCKLVEELERCAIPFDDIGLESVRAEVASGILGKSSSAMYRLRISCKNLELLPDVLGAVTAAKNSVLDDVEWRYPESADQQARWLQDCVAQANTKAEAAAAALGTRLVGVHRLTEQPLDQPQRPGYFEGAAPTLASEDLSAPRARIQMGFDLIHRKRAGLRVEVEYRVEGLRTPRT